MFINCTNHPSVLWSEAQIAATSVYGPIAELPFPNVPPQASEREVSQLGEEYAAKILELKPSAVLCQGEMTLTYQIVRRLLSAGVTVLAACSERRTTERINPDGSSQKVSTFEFCKYRAYTE